MDIATVHPVLKAFLAGSFSGTFSTILFQPLDLVKTRLQNPDAVLIKGRSNYGMLNIFTNVVQQERLFGLWKGMVPSLARCIPGVGIYFCSLDVLQKQLWPAGTTPGPIGSICVGVVARCLSGVPLIPITVVKTRFESGIYGYTGMAAALREICRTEGFRGMTCGLVPTLFRDAPFSGLYFMFYNQSKRLVPEECLRSQHTAMAAHFTCGLMAGVLASCVTQPADVLKTKMQLYPAKFNGVWSVVVYVHGKYGVRGYFKGMVPRMLRRTLMAAMAWTVYEQISRSIGLK